jgi:hypothetical protein
LRIGKRDLAVNGADEETKARDVWGRTAIRRALVTDINPKLRAIAAAFGLRGPRAELRAKLDAKGAYWFDTPEAPSEVKAIAALSSNKLLMRRYVNSLGLRLPQIYGDVDDVDQINFASIPDRVVIKPHNGWSSDAVMLIDREQELLSGAVVPRAELPDFCRKTLASARFAVEPRIIFEEFVQDYDQQFAIPRDFKVFVAGGKAWVVQVIDRNGPKAARSHSFYTRDWTRFADAFQTARLQGPSFSAPPLLAELISDSEMMARDLWRAI